MSEKNKPYVLLIDDRAEALDLLGQLLQTNGLNVISASDMNSALRAIKHADMDMIICDINLDPSNPKDRSGIQIAKFAAEAQPGVPIVANTAFFSDAEFSEYEKSLFTRLYTKGSASSRELIDRMKQLQKLALKHKTSLARARRTVKRNRRHDVFLCHNSADKPAVRRLATMLSKKGIRPWYDEWDLVPGKPWQEALEETIVHIRAVAVLVGKSGIGPWADREMRAFLGEFVRRGVSLIPVMLPGAPIALKLPLFLREFTWVDLRSGIRKKGIERLIWGVTGVKP